MTEHHTDNLRIVPTHWIIIAVITTTFIATLVTLGSRIPDDVSPAKQSMVQPQRLVKANMATQEMLKKTPTSKLTQDSATMAQPLNLSTISPS